MSKTISDKNQINRFRFGLRAKLITIFIMVMVIPLVLLAVASWRQFVILSSTLSDTAVEDTTVALDNIAAESLERLATDTAMRLAEFLYARDGDVLFLASLEPSEADYKNFINMKNGRIIQHGEWVLDDEGEQWVERNAKPEKETLQKSSNDENNEGNAFKHRAADDFTYKLTPYYDEITFIGLDGVEKIKVVASSSTKKHYPLSATKKDISKSENTYIKAENYFEDLKKLKANEVYVSDVIGAYVSTEYIGNYTPKSIEQANAAGERLEFAPERQAFAGAENPVGQRYEAIIRWAAPHLDENGEIDGYISIALNYEHIMNIIEHITPAQERYTEMPTAQEGNYAYMWDYRGRNICHPRHHSITGYDPRTGKTAIPWVEDVIYDAWLESGKGWDSFIAEWPEFDNQSHEKTLSPQLQKQGLVGLDGRYLNNTPTLTGWMELTEDGGSGSFFMSWDDIHKYSAAAAVPYFTGRYAPNAENNYSRRGFGIITLGAETEEFNLPAIEMEKSLTGQIQHGLNDTGRQIVLVSVILVILLVLIAIIIAAYLTGNINQIIAGFMRFKAGERHYRLKMNVSDEFGMMADSFNEMADSIVESQKSPVAISDMDGNLIYMNAQALKLVDKRIDEVLGIKYADITIFPQQSIYCPITALKKGVEAEVYKHVKNGKTLYIKGSAGYMFDGEGNKTGYIVESTDMSEMVLEQIKIEEQRTLLDLIFSTSPDLIWYKNLDGVYLAVNPRFAEISGLPIDEIVGKTAADVLSQDMVDASKDADNSVYINKKPEYRETIIPFADGHSENLEEVRVPLFEPNGERVGIVGYARNVTNRVMVENELRQTQTELEQAVRDANRANEHKSEFLARMSHEIRTPMNAIMGINNIVRRRISALEFSNKADIEANVEQIEISSQHLLGLLNDVLDISKIEAGKIEIAHESVNLPKLITAVAQIIKPRCKEKNINFIVNIDELEHKSLVTDPLRLRQVLLNLLGNAVKFTPEYGEIEFSVLCKKHNENRDLLEFSVRDTGIGISEDVSEAIFQPFEQAGRNIASSYGGTGLGLSISRSIVRLFGGDIKLESTPGKGSRFSFAVWMEKGKEIDDELSIEKSSYHHLNGKRLLLVDDVEVNRMIVASMLEETGIEITEAENGKEALDIFAASSVGYFDAVLMDILMPEMNGYEATQAMRALDRPDAKKVPIIAQTANAFKEDVDKALKIGMNAHVAKPVETDNLLEVLYRMIFK